ncbi:unnamed protein product [Lupinus luteus]|uniref:Uncharacterized protein n=1 Tax=Lupinus luteus TaxID=3873 RepID=A0AAV1WD42_LUPLU
MALCLIGILSKLKGCLSNFIGDYWNLASFPYLYFGMTISRKAKNLSLESISFLHLPSCVLSLHFPPTMNKSTIEFN